MADTMQIAYPARPSGLRRLVDRTLAFLRFLDEVLKEANAMQTEAERRYGVMRE